jgi:nitrogen fixation NifU-like protein
MTEKNMEKSKTHDDHLHSEKTGRFFSDKMLTLAYEPLNVGDMENPDGSAKIQNHCGDIMEIFLKLDQDKIINTKFLSNGCKATLACGSAVTELAKGLTVSQAAKITSQTIIGYLNGIPPAKSHCAQLAVKTLQKALQDTRGTVD